MSIIIWIVVIVVVVTLVQAWWQWRRENNSAVVWRRMQKARTWEEGMRLMDRWMQLEKLGEYSDEYKRGGK